MLFRKLLFIAAFCAFGSAAPAQQIIYYCVKDGNKLISNKPCAELAATESKRVNAEDLPPLSTMPGLSDNERQRGKTLSERLDRNDPQAPREPQARAEAEASEDQTVNEKKCADLQYYKEHIVALQRAVNNDWLNSEHRRVNEDMSRLNCGS
ncbi:MAG: hypothetical protein LBS49_00200 [Candidatus Accumulibacter sp.]|jgi:hypothetical protein|nr:hypothetical protein [Accumulibacter sp.]